MSGHISFGEGRDAVAEALARLLIDQIGGTTSGLFERETLSYTQRLDLLADALDAFYCVAGRLDRMTRLYVPAPRRAVSALVREQVLDRDGRRCLNCGALDDLTVDHVVPLHLGGAHALENFQTLCRPCNSSKGAEAIDFRLDAPPLLAAELAEAIQ